MKIVITIDTSESKVLTTDQCEVILEDIACMLNGFTDKTTFDTCLDMQRLQGITNEECIHGSMDYPYDGVLVKSTVNTETNVKATR